ncbi:hypothetical protein HID58_013081, partial [Brassica napus]
MRICFQSFLITNQFKTQLINSPPPPSWTYKNRYILFLCRSESSKFSHSLKFIKTFLKFAMANRSPETTANGQSSETTVRVLLRFCSNSLLGTRKNKRLRELREMEEFELHHWLSCWRLKDGDEASLEKIHH